MARVANDVDVFVRLPTCSGQDLVAVGTFQEFAAVQWQQITNWSAQRTPDTTVCISEHLWRETARRLRRRLWCRSGAT